MSQRPFFVPLSQSPPVSFNLSQRARLQKFGGTLTKKGAPILVKALVTKALGNEAVKDLSEAISESAGDVADLLSETAKKRIEHYEEEKSSIQGFRKALGDLAAQLAQQPDKRQQLIFFVDELDRCRPDFAMTLLERIKHLFNVERVVFVLSVDRQQLRNTVQHLYGCGENADVYLRRFIDLSYQLPKPAPHAFVSLLISRMHLTEFLSQRANGQREAKRLERYFIEVVDWLDLDLRTQEQCFTRLNAIIRLWKDKEFVPTDFLAVMVGLKVGRPQLFDQLRAGKTVMRDHLPKGSIEVKHLNSFLTDCLEVVNGQREHFRGELESLRQRHGPSPENASDEATAIRYKNLKYLLMHRDEVLRLLEFSADLR